MKDADYRRKTAEAAELRRAADAERAQVRQEREYHANRLDVLIHGLQTQLVGDQKALAELAATDPGEWVRQNQAMQQRYAQYQQAIAERQNLANRTSAEQERELEQWRKAEREKLQERLPEWRDKAKATAEQKLVAEFLVREGYTPEELNEVFDHRALVVARKAALYDQLQAAKAKQSKPAPPKVIKPGVAKGSNQPQQGVYTDALRKLRESGSEDAAMALLAAKRKK